MIIYFACASQSHTGQFKRFNYTKISDSLEIGLVLFHNSNRTDIHVSVLLIVNRKEVTIIHHLTNAPNR